MFLTTSTVCRAVTGSQACHRIRGLFHWHNGYCLCVCAHQLPGNFSFEMQALGLDVKRYVTYLE